MSLLKPATIRDIAGDPANWITPVTAGMGLRLRGSTSGYVGLKAPAAGSAVDFTLPSADGTSGQALVTSGSGVLSFASTLSTLAVSDLTATRIPYVGTAGRLVDSANLLWSNATSKLTVTGATGTGWEIGKDIICNNDGVHQTIGVSGYNSELQIALSRDCAIRLQDDYTNVIDFYSYAGYRFFTSEPGSSGIVASIDGRGKTQITARNTTTVPLTLTLASAQSANAFEINSSGGSGGNLFKITKDGYVGTLTVAPSGTEIGVVIRGAASQTGPLLQLQGISSTSASRSQAEFDTSAIDNTDATRKYRAIHRAYDTAAREYMRGWGDGSGGRIAVAAPASAPIDAHLAASQISFYLDETGHNLLIRAKYANGTTLKLATIALA